MPDIAREAKFMGSVTALSMHEMQNILAIIRESAGLMGDILRVNAKVDFMNGAAFSFDTSWVLPKEFEAIVNQGLRIVGTRGVFECDSQDRGTRSCIGGEGMATYNNNFKRETVDRRGRRVLRGYGVESIEDFAGNVAFLKSGGRLADLGGIWASGRDGLETTRIAVAVHESLAAGRPVRLR